MSPSWIVSRLLIAAAGALLLFGAYTALQVGSTVTAVSSDPLRDLITVRPPDAPDRQPGLAGSFARGERVNLLLLGYGGAGHDGAFLTDSIMFASLDAATGTATLISVPRDLWVSYEASKLAPAHQGRINEAFALGASRGDRDGGMRIAAEALAPILGVRIDRTIALDFRAFRAVVDKIGGIDVTVDRAFSSLYPRNDDSAIDDTWIVVSFRAGAQHMDGETALQYSRARYAEGIEGTDYARSARQQKVILATRDKVVRTGAAPLLLDLLGALRENVRTDLSLADMAALSDFARGYDDARTVKGALTSSNVLQGYRLPVSDGVASTLQPREADWAGVRAYVRRLVEYPGSLLEDPIVHVSASAKRAAAGDAAARLLVEVGLRARYEAAKDDDPATTVTSGGAAETLGFLRSIFGGTSELSAGDVTVRLGADWVPPKPFNP